MPFLNTNFESSSTFPNADSWSTESYQVSFVDYTLTPSTLYYTRESFTNLLRCEAFENFECWDAPEIIQPYITSPTHYHIPGMYSHGSPVECFVEGWDPLKSCPTPMTWWSSNSLADDLTNADAGTNLIFETFNLTVPFESYASSFSDRGGVPSHYIDFVYWNGGGLILPNEYGTYDDEFVSLGEVFPVASYPGLISSPNFESSGLESFNQQERVDIISFNVNSTTVQIENNPAIEAYLSSGDFVWVESDRIETSVPPSGLQLGKIYTFEYLSSSDLGDPQRLGKFKDGTQDVTFTSPSSGSFFIHTSPTIRWASEPIPAVPA